MEYDKSGSLPPRVIVQDLIGPIDYPMYELRTSPKFDPAKYRTGWIPPELSLRDYPDREIIFRQGLPKRGHGSFNMLNSFESTMDAVKTAFFFIEDRGYVPGVIPIHLEPRRGQSRDVNCNPGELLFAMAQMYWDISSKRPSKPILLASTRIIKDQLHSQVVISTPVTFTRSTYRYRNPSFDWIQKVPVYRIHHHWVYR